MNKNWAVRLGVLVAVLTLITASLVSGTFAKYTTEVSGTDTVRVAKFAFDVSQDGTGIDTTGAAINIFNVTTDSGITVSPAGIIAPGTTGTFKIDVSNTSEVMVDVEFTLEETNSDNIPVYYLYDGQRYSEKLSGVYTGDLGGTYKSLADLATDMEADAAVAIAGPTDGVTALTHTFNLAWGWSFEADGTGQSDEADTALGLDGIDEITLEITCTATQADF